MFPRAVKVISLQSGGQTNFESEVVEAVACIEDGVRGADDFERGD